MLTPEERFSHTETLLRQYFGETLLALHDDSEAHLGHAGAQSGASHYEVTLSKDALLRYGRLISLHRAVYQVLEGMIPTEIHALKITIIPR